MTVVSKTSIGSQCQGLSRIPSTKSKHLNINDYIFTIGGI